MACLCAERNIHASGYGRPCPHKGCLSCRTLRAMQSPFPSVPVTRFDVVMWFLRVQLWVLVVTAFAQLLTSVGYLFAPFSSPLLFLRFVGINAVPVLILLLFPAVLASSVLGPTTRDSVVSLADVKPLVGRCVGLALFVGSLGPLVLFFVGLAYGFATESSSLGLGTGPQRIWMLAQLIAPTILFFVGFTLAFGPAIRNSFRAR